MDTREAAARWVEAWRTGWLAHDPDRIAAVYADDCVFLSHPFREPGRGAEAARAYVEQAFADEERAEVRFAEPVVDGRRAAVEYWAVLETATGRQTLAGATILHFDHAGLVDRHLDYWATEDGARERPPAWGA